MLTHYVYFRICCEFPHNEPSPPWFFLKARTFPRTRRGKKEAGEWGKASETTSFSESVNKIRGSEAHAVFIYPFWPKLSKAHAIFHTLYVHLPLPLRLMPQKRRGTGRGGWLTGTSWPLTLRPPERHFTGRNKEKGPPFTAQSDFARGEILVAAAAALNHGPWPRKLAFIKIRPRVETSIVTIMSINFFFIVKAN